MQDEALDGAHVIRPVAHIKTPYPVKFGVPRQPGLVDALEGVVYFEPEFRDADAVRGLETFDYIWLIWDFSQNHRGGKWTPTVRPPRLGGTRRMGVFATRSSFRPNDLALSCVKLARVELDEEYPDGSRGPALHVIGADMMDGSPIYDIKPYLPISDSKPEAGHLKKNGLGMLKHLKEFKLENAAELNVGDVLKADVFAAGDKVDVTGTSKGHGYAGVIKRHGAQRTPTSHGGGPVHRHAGSMGSCTDPSRIFKGKIGAGHMGVDQVTVQNLDVVQVDPELNMLVIRGAIPGPKGGLVYVKSTAKIAPVKKGEGAGISLNPQKASARVNPQKASARNK